MDVKTLCLGALSFGEASGYDIKKFFECTFSHFFLAGYGSIYPALFKLTEQGWLTCRCEPQEGKPDRKVYQLTRAGRGEFIRELEATPPHHKVRSEFLVLLYFAHLLPKATLRRLVDERLAEMEQQLVLIEESDSTSAHSVAVEAPPGTYFCAGYGKAVLTAAHQYLMEQRDEIVAQGLDEKEAQLRN